MSQERFDDLTRALASGELSRARMLKLLGGAFLGSTLSGWGLLGWADDAEAKKHHGKKKKKKKKHHPLLPLSGPCTQFTLNADGSATPSGACQDFSTTTTLSIQASKDISYSGIASYLTANGFVADGSPTSGVFQKEDGTLVRSLLASAYSNSGNPNEIAALYYDVETDGSTWAYAAVWDNQQQTLLYILVDDGSGTVQTAPPSAASQPASTGSPSLADCATCDSSKLADCLYGVAAKTAGCLLKEGIKAGCFAAPTAPPCLIVVGACAAEGAVLAAGCSQVFGCGVTCVKTCRKNLCCGVTETACPPSTCCPSGQKCCPDGTCSTTDVCCVNNGCDDTKPCCNKTACCFGECCDAPLVCNPNYPSGADKCCIPLGGSGCHNRSECCGYHLNLGTFTDTTWCNHEAVCASCKPTGASCIVDPASDDGPDSCCSGGCELIDPSGPSDGPGVCG